MKKRSSQKKKTGALNVKNYKKYTNKYILLGIEKIKNAFIITNYKKKKKNYIKCA